jgi:hypothetical protein
MPSLFVRSAVQPEGARSVELWRRVGRAQKQFRRVDAELVHVDGMRRVDAFPDGERELVPLVHDDVRPVAPRVILEPVVADGGLLGLGSGIRRHDAQQDDGRRDQAPPDATA